MEKVHLNAFHRPKEMLQTEVKLAFPDFTKPFHPYTDASYIQLGATLVQDGRPLGFYTRKLNGSQTSYTVGEKELLRTVEGLKAFSGVIRGQDLTVHTDHLNLLYSKLPSQRMTRWRLLLYVLSLLLSCECFPGTRTRLKTRESLFEGFKFCAARN